MNSPADVRNQLQTLKIGREQRPSSAAGTGRRSRLGAVIVVLVAVSAAAAGGYFGRDLLLGGAAPGQKTSELRVITVALREDPAPTPVLTATGKIVSDHLVEVATKVSGQIVDLFFEQGDKIKKGQLLARVEEDLYLALRDEAAAQLDQARADLAFQEVNFARVQGLAESNNAPTIELASAKRDLDAARARVEAAQAALTAAQKAYDDCKVLAPIDGVVLHRNVEVGDFVAAEAGRGANANAQFATIADMDKLRVEVDISELDIARIRAGMPCRIVPDAYKERSYRGHVLWIDPGANYSKATVQVKVRIEEPDDFLRVEGSAQVMFLAEAETDGDDNPAIWIPESALKADEGGLSGTVYVLVDQKPLERVVAIGRRVDDQVEITSGLEPGQKLVADGWKRSAEVGPSP